MGIIFQIFHTRDALVRWVRKLGKTHRVAIIIRRSETTDGGKGKHNKIIFKCKRHGKYTHVVDVGVHLGGSLPKSVIVRLS